MSWNDMTTTQIEQKEKNSKAIIYFCSIAIDFFSITHKKYKRWKRYLQYLIGYWAEGCEADTF